MRSSLAAVAAVLAGLPAAAPAAQAEQGWTWPVRGRVLTAYVNDNARPYAGGMHRGIDIAAQEGTPVLAARAGTVTYAGALGSSGIVVAVRSDDERHVASYLHLAAESVSRGEHVGAGARIGAAGTTGRRSVSEPHLHFGVRLADVEDNYVDPLSLLPALGTAPAPPVPPAPLAAPAPLRAQEQVVRAPAGAIARPVGAVAPHRARARPRDARAKVPATGRVAGLRGRPVRHPVPAPAIQPRVAAPERGRPLLLGGLALLAVALFGSALVRLNGAVNRRAAALATAARRSLIDSSPRSDQKASASDQAT